MLIGVALLVSGRQKQTLRRREIHLKNLDSKSSMESDEGSGTLDS